MKKIIMSGKLAYHTIIVQRFCKRTVQLQIFMLPYCVNFVNEVTITKVFHGKFVCAYIYMCMHRLGDFVRFTKILDHVNL